MGEPDVEGLLERLSAEQLAEWMAYYAVEPFGEDRADLRIGILSSIVASALGGKRVTPEQFMLSRQARAPRRQSAEDMEAMLRTTSALIASWEAQGARAK